MELPMEFLHDVEQLLQMGNDHSRFFLSYENIITIPKAFDENIMVFLLKRFGELRQDTIDWWRKAPLGDYFFATTVKPKISMKRQVAKKDKKTSRMNKGSKHHLICKKHRRMELPPPPMLRMLNFEPTPTRSFQRIPARKEILTLGTTHVSVNWTDLTTLIFSHIVDNSDPANKQPLKWIGYETSPYAVAKALVVTEMLVSATSDHILQVSYSSVWTRETCAAFKVALNRVVDKFADIKKNFYTDGVDSSLVLALLKRWQITDVSLQHAFNSWLSYSAHAFFDIANFTHVADRIELTKYKLTGMLGGGQVGSTTMFATLASIPKRQRGENFLTGIPVEVLQNVQNGQGHIIDLATTELKNGIQNLMNRVRDRSLEISIRIGQVDSHAVLQASIKSIDAYTMHWHCTPDLHDTKEFHDIAFKCSGSETVHTMTSIDWQKRVKGASIIDYPDAEYRTKLIASSKKCLETLTNKAYGQGSSQRLNSPPFMSPFIMADYCTASLFANKYVETTWKSTNARLGQTHFFPWNLFGSLGAIHVSWTYNSSIQFEPVL
jgi:hypothetical protein